MGYKRKQAKARAEELLHAFNLEEAATKQVKNYSGGMRRRIDIAASIVVTPELLFLDEPTTGLDPRSRNQVWDIVRTLVNAGTTVLLTTQYLEEADQLADRIAVINHGKIIAEGTSSELKASVGTNTLHITLQDESVREKALRVLEESGNIAIHPAKDAASLTAQMTDPTLAAAALGKLADEQIAVSTFSLGQPSLDEVFLTLTGEEVGNAEKNGEKSE